MKKWTMSVALSVSAAAVMTGVLTTTASAHGPAPVSASAVAQHSVKPKAKPTVVLVTGAFEDGSAFSGVTRRLQHDGYTVIVPALPMRSLAGDVAYLQDLLKTVPGPLVLDGHSYGGMVISEVAAENANVKALVYSAAFIPVAGESAGQLDAQFPGSLLGPDTTHTVAYGAGNDLYVNPGSFRALFAGDRSAADAAVAAASQRPLDAAALTEPATAAAPADVPKYAIVATQDKAIPPAAELFEAKRAGATVSEVRSAHDLPTTHPDAVAAVIEQAANHC